MRLCDPGCYVIAEVGSCHMGDPRAAEELIAQADMAGADAAKFQLFRPEDIAIDPSRIDPRTVLPPEWISHLAGLCREHRIDFLCTPFAPWAVEAIAPYVPYIKIGSFEWRRHDVWGAAFKTGKEVIASNGRGEGLYRADHTLYCVSRYPAAINDIHLPQFDLHTLCGFSDHTTSTVLPALAVARGAHIIEKHIRLDNTPPDCPDYPHSLSPGQFANMVDNIDEAEAVCWQKGHDGRILDTYANRREE